MSELNERPSVAERLRRNVGLKIVTGAAVGMTLCLGLCQVGFYLGRNVHDGAPNGLDAIGGLGFLLFAFLLIVGIVVAMLEFMG